MNPAKSHFDTLERLVARKFIANPCQGLIDQQRNSGLLRSIALIS
jgi:hypothetical protein